MNIDEVAALARIKLQPAEKQALAEDLEKILRYVEKLKEIPTDQIQPTSHVLEIENVFREDQASRSDVREQALKHAPEREGDFFRVPKVIEGE